MCMMCFWGFEAGATALAMWRAKYVSLSYGGDDAGDEAEDPWPELTEALSLKADQVVHTAERHTALR